VVYQIEHARETGSGAERLVPRTVFVLRAQQINHAAGHAFAARVAYSQQPHDCPCGLRSGAFTLPSEVGIVDDIKEGRLNIDLLQKKQAEKELQTAEEVLPRAAREC